MPAFDGPFYEGIHTDSELSADDLDDTGVTKIYDLQNFKGILIEVVVTWPNPATDDLDVEVFESIDGANPSDDERSSDSVTITKSAGATTRTLIRIEDARYLHVTYKSAGATDTPTVTVRYSRYGTAQG